jgi:thioredoxin-related protein
MILLLTFVFSACEIFSGAGASKTIKWQTIEKVIGKKNKKKKVFIEVYTNWCGWCKRMEKSTFNDPAIARYINTHFYSVKFDAESRKAIDFQGKTFNYSTAGRRGRHELATVFMQDN